MYSNRVISPSQLYDKLHLSAKEVCDPLPQFLALSPIGAILVFIMSMEEEIRTVPNRPHLHCPVCDARVAEGAKTCLMCGASLEDAEALTATVTEEGVTKKQLTWQRLAILGSLTLVILTTAVLLGLNLSHKTSVVPTATATVTTTPTMTRSPTSTPSPTTTPSPFPTATPVPPEEYTIQAGDTLLSIALKFDLTVPELKDFNYLEDDTIVVGQALLIPPPTPTPGPTPTWDLSQPTPTYAPYLLHTVKRGDTLSTIAESYQVSIADIRWANDIPTDSTTVQVNQVLQIPHYTPTPEAPQPEMVRDSPATQDGYAAPTLLYPPEGMTFTGAQTLIMLQWTSTGILEEEEYYQVKLVTPSGDKPESTAAYLRSTAWRVPEKLFPALEIANRTCSWSVAIVRRSGPATKPTYIVIKPAAEERTFSWRPISP